MYTREQMEAKIQAT